MRLSPALLLLSLVSCQTVNPAVTSGFKLPPDTRSACALRCEELGMRLGAIVLIRNSAGCVCEPSEAGPTRQDAPEPRASLRGGSAAAGGALIVALEEEVEEQRSQEAADAERQRRAADTGHAPGMPPGAPLN